MTNPSATAEAFEDDRFGRLRDELNIALSGTDRAALQAWARRSSARAPTALWRRGVRLTKTLAAAAKLAFVETRAAIAATRRGELEEHAANRAQAGVAATRAVAVRLTRLVASLKAKPQRAAPELLGVSIGFLTGAGGLDGDGGIPDLDLAAGIGAHRSILTHSVIAGAAAETLIAAALDLVLLVHARLPDIRDPLWDRLATAALRAGAAAKIGIDAGLCAHLTIDATVDGMTPYKDLPLPLPIEGHRALLLANAATEGAIAFDDAAVLWEEGETR